MKCYEISISLVPSLTPHDMPQMHNVQDILQVAVGQASVGHVGGRIRVYHLIPEAPDGHVWPLKKN